MKDRRSNYTDGFPALAAHAALNFAAQRKALHRHLAWHPMTLFWRQKRKRLEGLQARRVSLAAWGVWAPQFHLQFITSVVNRPPHGSILGWSSVGANDQRRVMALYQRTVVQSGMYVAQLPRAQRLLHIFSVRHAQANPGIRVQVASPSANSGRSKIPVTATWVTDRAQRPHPEQTHQRVRLSTSKEAQAQTFRAPRIYKHEPHALRLRGAVISTALPLRSQPSITPQLYGRTQELVWRRTMQPSTEIAARERPLDQYTPSHPTNSRLYPGNETMSGLSHSSGNTTALPLMKIDSGLMDRLADDVIRRVEQRARIARERRGL